MQDAETGFTVSLIIGCTRNSCCYNAISGKYTRKIKCKHVVFIFARLLHFSRLVNLFLPAIELNACEARRMNIGQNTDIQFYLRNVRFQKGIYRWPCINLFIGDIIHLHTFIFIDKRRVHFCIPS